MVRPDFEELEIYRLSEALANEIWNIAKSWPVFEQNTIGNQLVKAADSICANIAEGRGRHNYRDNQRFIKIARGSLYETVCFLRLAYKRQLISPEQSAQLKSILDTLLPKLNAYLKSLNR